MIRWFEYGQVYHPTREWSSKVPKPASAFEDVYFKAEDGVRLNAWFLAARTSSPRSRFAMLICHGNGGNISHRSELYEALLRLGVNVLAFDYRGYGHSEGKLSEAGTYRDAQAAYQWLRQRGFQAQHIIAFGESLGGAIATELTVREPVGGLILQSAFTSIPDVGVERFPWLPIRRLHSIKYETIKKLPGLKVPVLVMHSRRDETIRFHHGEKNFAAANDPKLFWETRSGHNYECAADFEHCAEGVEKFLQLIEPQR